MTLGRVFDCKWIIYLCAASVSSLREWDPITFCVRTVGDMLRLTCVEHSEWAVMLLLLL